MPHFRHRPPRTASAARGGLGRRGGRAARREARKRRSVRAIQVDEQDRQHDDGARGDAAAASGYFTARKSRKAVRPSSASEASQFVTGSGLVLMTARVDDFSPCAESATPPQTSAATIRHCSGTRLADAAQARSAAAGTRMKVCTRSQTESTIGILSARNSTR